MRLSTKTRYGARAMAELAVAYEEGALSVRDIAQSQQVSAKYLEQIMSALKAAGLVEAARGMGGGYVLTRPPDRISLGEVFRVLEGSPAPVACVEAPDSCPMTDICPTRDTWVEMAEAIERILAGTTLRELAEREKRRRGAAGPPMYHI